MTINTDFFYMIQASSVKKLKMKLAFSVIGASQKRLCSAEVEDQTQDRAQGSCQRFWITGQGTVFCLSMI